MEIQPLEVSDFSENPDLPPEIFVEIHGLGQKLSQTPKIYEKYKFCANLFCNLFLRYQNEFEITEQQYIFPCPEIRIFRIFEFLSIFSIVFDSDAIKK